VSFIFTSGVFIALRSDVTVFSTRFKEKINKNRKILSLKFCSIQGDAFVTTAYNSSKINLISFQISAHIINIVSSIILVNFLCSYLWFRKLPLFCVIRLLQLFLVHRIEHREPLHFLSLTVPTTADYCICLRVSSIAVQCKNTES